MRYFKKLVGNKVYFSPINIDDAEQYTEWLNDFEVSKNIGSSHKVISVPQERELLEKLRQGTAFAIVDLATDKLLGNCGFHNIDNRNRTAELGIFIGSKDYRGKGYGEDAVRLLLDFGFSILNLNSVMLVVKEFNKQAIACYKKCGFQVIGTRRETNIYGDRKFGNLYMDILACEFEGAIVKKFLDE